MKIFLPTIAWLSMAVAAPAAGTPAPSPPRDLATLQGTFTTLPNFHARYLPKNEISELAVIRIYSGNDFTILTPLTVKVWVFGTKGELLPDKLSVAPYDWMEQNAQEMAVKRSVAVEIPVQTYTSASGGIGDLKTILDRYDTKSIGSVWITFKVQYKKGKEEEAGVEIPRNEALQRASR